MSWARQGLDLLLAELPGWELDFAGDLRLVRGVEPPPLPAGTWELGWLSVEMRSPLGVQAQFSVWRATGAVYRTDGGEVHEDPWLVPEGSPYGGEVERWEPPPWSPAEARRAFDPGGALGPVRPAASDDLALAAARWLFLRLDFEHHHYQKELTVEAELRVAGVEWTVREDSGPPPPPWEPVAPLRRMVARFRMSDLS